MKKVLQFSECGGPEKLSLIESAVKEPQATEVRFNVGAYALNQADLLYLRGEHTTKNIFPSRIASEACGVVDSVGPDVTRFKVGDRVSSIPFLTNQYGVAGEFAVTPECFLTLALPSLNDVENSALWMQYLTAYFPFVHIAGIGSTDTVLIGAGASSAGIAAIQLAKSLGATVIATTRTADKKAFIQQVGADVTLIDGSDNFYDAIMSATNGRGVNVSYDPIGGRFMSQYALALAKEAKVFHYGALSPDADELPMLDLLRRMAVIYPYSMFNYVDDQELLPAAIAFIKSKIDAGELRPIIDRVFNFDQSIEAYHYMLSNKQRGKITVSIK